GYAIEEFHDEGILFEGGTPPPDMMAASVPMLGKRFMQIVEDIDRTAVFGFLVSDTSRGRVHFRKGRTFITYVMNDSDVARVRRGIEILARVFFAGGARPVLTGVHGFDELSSDADMARFRRASLSARDFSLAAYHPLGTARMSRDPNAGVV